MERKIDLLSIPDGYSSDIHEFCISILEVAMLKGENDNTFDDEFLNELIDREISVREQEIILNNAQRFLNDKQLVLKDVDIYEVWQENFELGCREFSKLFLHHAKQHSIVSMRKDVWKVELKVITPTAWMITKTLHSNKD